MLAQHTTSYACSAPNPGLLRLLSTAPACHPGAAAEERVAQARIPWQTGRLDLSTPTLQSQSSCKQLSTSVSLRFTECVPGADFFSRQLLATCDKAFNLKQPYARQKLLGPKHTCFWLVCALAHVACICSACRLLLDSK